MRNHRRDTAGTRGHREINNMLITHNILGRSGDYSLPYQGSSQGINDVLAGRVR